MGEVAAHHPIPKVGMGHLVNVDLVYEPTPLFRKTFIQNENIVPTH